MNNKLKLFVYIQDKGFFCPPPPLSKGTVLCCDEDGTSDVEECQVDPNHPLPPLLELPELCI